MSKRKSEDYQPWGSSGIDILTVTWYFLFPWKLFFLLGISIYASRDWFQPNTQRDPCKEYCIIFSELICLLGTSAPNSSFNNTLEFCSLSLEFSETVGLYLGVQTLHHNLGITRRQKAYVKIGHILLFFFSRWLWSCYPMSNISLLSFVQCSSCLQWD